MIAAPLWQTLKNLVLLDNDLLTLEATSREIEKRLSTAHKELKQQQEQLSQLRNAEHTAKKEVCLAELALQEIVAALEHKKKQYTNCQTSKEMFACEHELAQLSHKQHEQEELVIKTWLLLDEATRALQQAQMADTTQQSMQEAHVQALETEHTLLLESAATKQTTRNTLAAQVSPEWLSRYEAMRNAVPNPIVPVVQSACSSCFYSIAAQDLMRIKRSGLLPCKSCYRLLYCEDTPLDEAQSNAER